LLWNLYFLIKLGLHIAGLVSLNPILNLVLFILLIASNPANHLPKRKFTTALRYLIFTGPAIALLLHELGLVVSWAFLDQIKALFGFSLDYLWELISRTIEPWIMWGVLTGFMLIRVLGRYIRISTVVGIGLLSTLGTQILSWAQQQTNLHTSLSINEPKLQARENLSPAELLALGQLDYQKLRVARNQESQTHLNDSTNENSTPSSVLQHFFDKQHSLVPSTFTPNNKPDFDVIMLQVCSLSWADLQSAKQGQHPVIRQADFVFENFNSASSYSGPATIRLLRGKCGQSPHKALYDATNSSCMLFEQLRNVGFEIEIGLNHDGQFQDFSKLVQVNLGNKATQRVAHNEVPLGVLAFDGSEVGRDGDYLRAWWNKRIERPGTAVAYYYNTITLHDGNRLPNSNLNSINSYSLRLERLLNDVRSMLNEIRRSDRKALVIVVPEHGAGLTGEYGQLVGLRELPTPAITKVPVFGYWIAPGYNQSTNGPVNIKQPVSYTALSELLARWMSQSGEQQLKPAWPVLLNNLPDTRLVSQQGDITVMESQGFYWLKAPGSAWKVLGPAQAIAASN
jgi:cellulose synthase operon protein YhjU